MIFVDGGDDIMLQEMMPLKDLIPLRTSKGMYLIMSYSPSEPNVALLVAALQDLPRPTG